MKYEIKYSSHLKDIEQYKQDTVNNLFIEFLRPHISPQFTNSSYNLIANFRTTGIIYLFKSLIEFPCLAILVIVII